MRILAVLAAVCFWLWAWWRSLPVEAHHVFCVVALWFAWAFYAAMILSQ